VLFLKWLDDYELDKEKATRAPAKTYTRIISSKFRWNVGRSRGWVMGTLIKMRR
jgi:hypothetical protein